MSDNGQFTLGNLTSLSLEETTGHILASYRPTTRNPSLRHQVRVLYTFDPSMLEKSGWINDLHFHLFVTSQQEHYLLTIKLCIDYMWTAIIRVRWSSLLMFVKRYARWQQKVLSSLMARRRRSVCVTLSMCSTVDRLRSSWLGADSFFIRMFQQIFSSVPGTKPRNQSV